jgi:hypothetical protein
LLFVAVVTTGFCTVVQCFFVITVNNILNL